MLGSLVRARRVASTIASVVLASATSAPARASSFAEAGWGYNQNGQLGNGTRATSDVPVAVKGLAEVVAVAGGGENNLALLGSGEVMGWGVNGVGELCTGNHIKSEVPIPIQGVGEAAAIALGEYDSLILLKNGTIVDCGGNEFGQLGNGIMGGDFDVAEPVGGLSGVTAIGASGDTSYALLGNGTVMAWGNNESGQLGDGSTSASDVPVPVSALHNVIAIAAGRKYGLALLGNGTVMAWGNNEAGQLGDGTTTRSETAVPVRGLSEVTAISADNPSLALLTNGTVMAWGENRYGQIGDGNTANSDVPVPVSGLHGVTAVSSGSGFALALLSDGRVMAWGRNSFGQLGNGTTNNSDVPAMASDLSEVAGITATSGDDSFAFGLSMPSLAAPQILELRRHQGPATGGEAVTITGRNFTAATAVDFGPTSAASFQVDSPTTITAVTPAEPVGVVKVSVTTPVATTVLGAVDDYAFQPTISHLTPALGPTAGGTAVTITGSGFAVGKTGTSVQFGSTSSSSVDCVSTTTCVAVAPAHAAGVAPVVAIASGVASSRVPQGRFTYR